MMSTVERPAAMHAAFTFPLNVYAQAIWLETGALDSLHFGIYRTPRDTLFDAQRNATALLFSRLPPPPARVLEVGVGLGVTLRELMRRGYTVVGISPDARQLSRLDDLADSGAVLVNSRFEDVPAGEPGYDVVLFQESAQYIKPPSLLIDHSLRLLRPGGILLMMDEFPGRIADALREQADAAGFECRGQMDLTSSAVPSVRELAGLIERHEAQLSRDLDPAVMVEGLAAALREVVAAGAESLGRLDAAETACLQRVLGYLQRCGPAADDGGNGQLSIDNLRRALRFVEENRSMLQRDVGIAALMVRELTGTLRKRCGDYACGAWRYCLMDLRKHA